MKRLIFLVPFLVFFLKVFSQPVLSVKVFDAQTKTNLYANVELQSDQKAVVLQTDPFGHLRTTVPVGRIKIVIYSQNYLDTVLLLQISKDTTLAVGLIPTKIKELEEIVVRASRLSWTMPIAQISLSSKQLNEQSLVKDVPLVLKTLPSVIFSTDAGTGIGYTNMWIRGSDITRINVTINGVPLNDPESHGVWWVDVPNLMDITDEIIVQRGVGASTLGAGAFGASVLIQTNRIKNYPFARFSNTIGSFNTLKHSFSLGSGIINNHWYFEATVNKTHSDGYIDRAWANTHSVSVLAAYVSDNSIIKFSFLKGFEETYQAWAGVPKDSLKTNRTFNPYTYENEIDHYEQFHYNIQINQRFGKNTVVSLTPFLIRGFGYYEQFKENDKYSKYGLPNLSIGDTTIKRTDLIRRKWLDNYYYGINYSLDFAVNNFVLTYGGQWSNYIGNHFGEILWMKYAGNVPKGFRWYFNYGIKNELNNFVKLQYSFKHLTFFVDVQNRLVNYKIEGKNDDLRLFDTVHHYNFLNPKMGFYINLSKKISLFGMFGVSNKEPKRSDYIDSKPDKYPKPETLLDYELGAKYQSQLFSSEINLFYMYYKNQLVLTGEINNVGAPIVTNVPVSYRRGIEICFAFKPLSLLSWDGNIALSQNKIVNFVEYVDDWDNWPQQIVNNLGTTNISFSPSVIANSILTLTPIMNFDIQLTSKYVSRVYIDNTSSIERSLEPYFVSDLTLKYSLNLKNFPNITLIFDTHNLFNTDYISNAWVYSYYSGGQRFMDAGYFPQAFRHYIFTIRLDF